MKKLISIVLAIMTIVGLMIPVFAGAEAKENATMWVNCSDGRRLNVREKPDGKVLYRIECGTKVEVQSSASAPKGWAFITVKGQKKGGYVKTQYLFDKKPGKYEITERADNFVEVTPYNVTAKALNDNTDKSVGLRTKPNKVYKSIRRLAAGDVLQVVAEGKTWSRVVDPSTGATGYVANDYMIRQ
ncbi:MAG: SH3 domain-containing protein [Clostridia bacterium]|nr:SH3 domain-containing protein [Clostridia bacterium]